jgi:hypothetical protein
MQGILPDGSWRMNNNLGWVMLWVLGRNGTQRMRLWDLGKRLKTKDYTVGLREEDGTQTMILWSNGKKMEHK